MPTVKQFRMLIVIHICVHTAAMAAIGWQQIMMPIPGDLSPEQKADVLKAIPGPLAESVIAVGSISVLILYITAWIKLFRLQIRGRTFFAIAAILSITLIPFMPRIDDPTALSALIDAGLYRTPNPLLTIIDPISYILSGVLLTIVYSNIGERLFRKMADHLQDHDGDLQ